MLIHYFFEELTYGQILLFYCFVGLSILYSVYFFLRRFFPGFIVQECDYDFMGGLHAALFTITFLTLGYSLSNVNDTIDKYQQDVVTEANELKSLDVLFTLYDTKDAVEFRQDLRNYANSIVVDEWPLLSTRKSSEKTLNLQRKLIADLQELNPKNGKDLAIYSRILEKIPKVVQERSNRILNSDAHLSPQFLLTNNMGYIGVLIISALMLTQFTWFRFITLNIQVIAVSFIFASTIALDTPFKGTNTVSPEPIALFAQSPIVDIH